MEEIRRVAVAEVLSVLEESAEKMDPKERTALDLCMPFVRLASQNGYPQ
jgi:hypothetical protein